MSDLEELIQTANRLSINLDKAAQKDKQFCVDVCQRLEQMSWEIFRTANELKEIRNYI